MNRYINLTKNKKALLYTYWQKVLFGKDKYTDSEVSLRVSYPTHVPHSRVKDIVRKLNSSPDAIEFDSMSIPDSELVNMSFRDNNLRYSLEFSPLDESCKVIKLLSPTAIGNIILTLECDADGVVSAALKSNSVLIQSIGAANDVTDVVMYLIDGISYQQPEQTFGDLVEHQAMIPVFTGCFLVGVATLFTALIAYKFGYL